MADQFTEKVIAEKYRVDSLIRKGGLGDLYRGWHLFMDKPLTLKILAPELAVDDNIRQRFSAEARNAVHITHPNILAVSDFGTAPDSTVYIVFEGFEGETLQDALNRDGQFTVERTAAITNQIASALTEAGSKGLFHGKLNPENILLSTAEGETVKVFDFSSANDGSQSDARNSYNVSYLAPEQFTAQRNADARSDVYSLGIVVYQMLSGSVPFKGETPTDVMLKHTEDLPPAFASFRTDLPSAIEPVVLKALQKNPDQRYQTTKEFADALSEASNPAAGVNNLWKTAFIVVTGISLLAMTLIYATTVKQTDPTTQLQPDANGQPVQPINPATGLEEQNLAAMSATTIDTMGNSNSMPQPPGTLPGGDGYNAWGNGGMPPPGAPAYVPPGGQTYTIDPNTGSPFMPNDTGIILVPVPAGTNTAPKPSPTPKTPAANVNTATPTAPKTNPDTKPTPVPKATAPPKTDKQPVAPKSDKPNEL